MKFIIIILVCISSTFGFSQENVNQNDTQGNKHGVWKKFYPGTKQLRYAGTFEHGKEVGTFKFYCQDCKDQPSVVKEFSKDSDTAKVSYYTIKGKLVSEGTMVGRSRVGEWVYYQEKSKDVLSREFYKNGKLEGEKTTYYSNGQKAETLQYVNGKREGLHLVYATNGTLLKSYTFKNDVLEGPTKYYDASGNLILDGNYVNDRKKGVWKTYKNGSLVKEEIFPKPYRNRE